MKSILTQVGQGIAGWFMRMLIAQRALLLIALASLFILPGYGILGLIAFCLWYFGIFARFKRLDTLDRWVTSLILLIPVYVMLLALSVVFAFVFPPLGLLLIAIGLLGLNAALWLSVFRLCKAGLGRFGVQHWAATAAMTLAVMAAIPAALNARLSQHVADLQRGDRPFVISGTTGIERRVVATKQPLPDAGKIGGPVAVISNESANSCSELCMRLFLKTDAAAVIQAKIDPRKSDPIKPLAKISAVAFRRTAIEQCPKIHLDRGRPEFEFENDQLPQEREAVASLMRVAIGAKGCIERETGVLTNARQGIVFQSFGKRSRRAIVSMNPMLVAARGERHGYLLRDRNVMRWRYRATRVKTNPLAPLLLISIGSRGQMSLAPTLLRLSERVFEPAEGVEFHSIENLISKKIGLDLSLDASRRQRGQKEAIESLLDLKTAFTPAREGMLKDWFKQVSGQAILTDEQKELARAIYRQTAVRLPLYATGQIVKAAGSDEVFKNEIADLLMQRFDLITSRYHQLKRGEAASETERRLLHATAVNIKYLPDELMRPRLDHLVKALKNSPTGGEQAWNRKFEYIVPRLTLLSEDHLPMLLANRGSLGQKQFRRLLCLFGPRAASIRSEAEKILFSYRYSRWNGKIGRNTLRTLLGMGSEPEVLWRYYDSYNNPKRPDLRLTRESFDSTVKFVHGMDPYRCVYH